MSLDEYEVPFPFTDKLYNDMIDVRGDVIRDEETQLWVVRAR